MTMRNRQFLVAVGLVILAAWFLFTWRQSSSAPEPTPGPSPTGAIGSAPLTFAPSDSGGPSPTASGAPGASGGTSPGGSGGPVPTPAPGATAPPAQAVRWSGTWANTSPDNATGSLEIVWTQDGSALQGVADHDGVSCFTAGGIRAPSTGTRSRSRSSCATRSSSRARSRVTVLAAPSRCRATAQRAPGRRPARTEPPRDTRLRPT